MRCRSLASLLASAIVLLAGCTSSGDGTVVTILGYTVVIKTAPPATAQVGTSVPVAFTVTESRSDGTGHPAAGKSFTVTVTSGGGTINGAGTATLTTGADGSVSVTWVLGPTAGPQTVRGSVSSEHFLDVSVATTPPAVSTVSVTIATPSVVLGTVGDQAAAVLKDASGNVLLGRAVTWQSSNLTVATINGSGVITTVGVGTSTITALSEGQSGGALLTVTQVPVSTVTVSLGSSSIVLGTVGHQATAVVRDAGGNVLLGRTVTWQSSNLTVATINGSGVITTVGVGTSTITGLSEGQSGGALLTVTVVPVNTVTTTLAANTITIGTVGDLATAVLKDVNGNVLQGRVVTWQSSDLGVATISATGVITTVGVGTTTISATSETKVGNVLLTVTQPTWNAAWTLRRQVTVTTTTASAPTGYSVAVQLGHAALVAGGKALASGNDVRVLYWTGATWIELDRVLDAGSTWNSATTTIWFKTQTALGAVSSDNNYYIYYGNNAATAPPASSANVFLFTDDFEAGNINKWTPEATTLWSATNTRAHGGTFALTHPSESATGIAIFANPGLNVADIYLDAWWNVNTLASNWNVAQDIRYTANAKYYTLFCVCIGPALGWNVAKFINGVYTDVAGPLGGPVVNTWMRIGTAISGSTYQVFVNGTMVRNFTGMTGSTSGNIAFDKYIVPAASTVWIDDVVARRFVTPEPTAAAGSEQAAP